MLVPYRSRRISRKQRLLSGGKTFISSPYMNFVYEIAPYLNIPVSDAKNLFRKDCEYFLSMCEHIYKRFRKIFIKNCSKSGLATYIP